MTEQERQALIMALSAQQAQPVVQPPQQQEGGELAPLAPMAQGQGQQGTGPMGNILQALMQSKQFGGAGTGASAGAGGTGAEVGGAGAELGSGAGAGSSGMSGLASMWPAGVAAAAIAQHQWAKGKGLHDDKDALLGRALLKDSAYYQQKGNEKLGGLGDEMRLAALGSSPLDLLHGSTWKEAAKLALGGGVLGKTLKKIF